MSRRAVSWNLDYTYCKTHYKKGYKNSTRRCTCYKNMKSHGIRKQKQEDEIVLGELVKDWMQAFTVTTNVNSTLTITINFFAGCLITCQPKNFSLKFNTLFVRLCPSSFSSLSRQFKRTY